MARLELQFGALVRHHRKRAGLSQAQLAEKIGRQPNAVQKLETGKSRPTFETLVRLAQALDVDVRDLFGIGDFAARDGNKDSLVRILKAVSPLSEQELAIVDAMLRSALKLTQLEKP